MTGQPPTTADHDAPPPPPRAFAQGAGVLMQTIGIIMALSSCCVGALAGKWEKMLDRGEVYQQIAQGQTIGVPITRLFDEPGRAGVMLTVVFTTVGGLALAGFGLGLQSQTPRSAWGALVSTALLLVVLIAAGVGLWVGTAAVVTRLWHAALTVTVLALLGFAIAALKQVMANPPPRDLHTVPPGFDARDVLAGEKPSKRTIEELRARLEVQQRELERLERELENPNDQG